MIFAPFMFCVPSVLPPSAMIISVAPAIRAIVSGNSRASFSAGMITEILILARAGFAPGDAFGLRKTLRPQRSSEVHLGDFRKFRRAMFFEKLFRDRVHFLAGAFGKLYSVPL